MGHFTFRLVFELATQLFLVGLHVCGNPTILPYNNAFVLQRLNKQSTYLNSTQLSDIYLLQNGCPSSPDQIIGQRVAGHFYSTNIYTAIQNPYCVVSIKLAQEQVYLDRPYTDVVVMRDPVWINLFKYRLCITVQFTNNAGASVAGSCILHERHLHKQICVIRQIIPFSWFELRADQLQPSEHLISVSYSVNSQCSAPEYPLFNQRVRLLSTAEKFSVFATNQQPHGQLSLLTRPGIQFTADSLNTVIFHFKPQANNNEIANTSRTIILWVWIDTRFEIVSATALEPSRWRMKVESASKPNSYVTFVLTASDDADNFETSFESYLFVMLLRLRSDNERADPTVRSGANAFLFVDWAMVRSDESLEQFEELANSTLTKNRIAKQIPITNDSPYTAVAVTKSIDIINTAVLNGLQVSEPMRIFMLSEAGEAQDVTDQSHCSSAEPRLLKVSSTCSSVYVDGSELRGLANVYIHIKYKMIRAGAAFNIWFPRLPISVWVADKTLNAVSDWRVPGWKYFDRRRRRQQHNIVQSVCQNRYQQTEIRVLAAFQVIDETTGEQTYLSGRREELFDVTQIVMSRVESTESHVLVVKRRDDRLIVNGKNRGTARVVVRAVKANVDYGGAQITVVDEPVSAVQLLLRSITDVQINLKPKHGLPFQYELITQIRSEFTQQNQHGSLEIEIFYSDGQRELLSDVDTSLYMLNIFSASERSLRVRQQKGSSNIELVMLDAGSQIDSMLTAEMRGPSMCEESELSALASGQTRLNSQLKRLYSLSDGRSYPDADRIQLNISGKTVEIDNNSFNLQAILALLLILLLVFGVFHIISVHSQGFHNGYEKLVMPIIARLSSSGSLASEQVAEGENTKEWIWMPKNQLDNMSVASHFSQRSTLGISNATTSVNETSSSPSDDSLSTGCNTNKSVSISYRGSEISICIAPQAAVSVNKEQRLRHQPMESWRSINGRPTRVQRLNGGRYRYSNEIGTSSVHDNLDKYCRNMPLSQSARASSTLNGITRRSSDQTHQNAYFSNCEKRARKELQRLQLAAAPDQTTLNAHEFFAGPCQSNDHNMSYVPFAKENHSILPSYASVYSNDDELQQQLINMNCEFSLNEHHNLYHEPENSWLHHNTPKADNVAYVAQSSSRNYQSGSRASAPMRETMT